MNTQYIKYMLLPAALISTMAVAQEEETKGEQVNVAFRTVAAEDVLGGVSSINYEEIAAKNNNTYSLDNMQGYTSGFNGASLWGMSDYLVLVDGVPRQADNIKPEEIASVTFLKGANAVILYGSRAANGAILITTKRGKQGDIQIDVHANTGWNTIKALPKYIGAAEYMSIYNTVEPGTFSDQKIYDTYAGTNPYLNPNNDLLSEDYIKKAYNRWEASAEIKGGGERAQYYTNIGYYRNGDFRNFGIHKGNYTDRLNVRGNVDMKLADWITAYVDANVSFWSQRQAVGQDFWAYTATERPHRIAFFLDPSMVSPYASNALAVLEDAQLINGMLISTDKIAYNNDEQNFQYALGDGYLKGKSNDYSRNFEFTAGINLDLDRVTKGLSFKTMLGVDYATRYRTYFTDDYAMYVPTWSSFNGKDEITGLEKINVDRHSGTQSVSNSTYTQTIAFNAHFDYDRSFGDHNVFAMLLANGFQQTKSGVYHAVSNANLGLSIDYNYAHKYYLQLGSAMVHSAKLAEGHRQGLNYSITAGWNIAKENFLEGGIFDDLTLSASTSLINQDIDVALDGREYYLYAGNYDQANGAWWDWGGSDGRESTQSKRGANEALDFIKRKEMSVSLRGAMFEKSLKFNASLFTNSIEGKLYTPTTIFPSYFTTGYPATSFNPVYNFNNDKRYGFEVGLSYNKKFGEVELGLGANLTWYNTEATKRDDTAYADEYQFRQGKPLDTIWGYESLGFFTSEDEIANSPGQNSFGEAPRPGDLKYKDQNGDGTIDSKDQIDLGRGGWYGAPLTLGLNFTAKYKGFTLFVLGVGGFGGQGNKVNIGQPSGTNNKGYFAFSGDAKYSVIARDCWTPETAGTALYPRLTSGSGGNNFQTSDFWLYKTDRFDIAKIQLTYDCPSSWFESQKIVKGVSVFVNGANLFTFAPEKEILELNVRQAPQSRFFQGGLIVNF